MCAWAVGCMQDVVPLPECVGEYSRGCWLLSLDVRFSVLFKNLHSEQYLLINPTLWHYSCVCSAVVSALGFLMQQLDNLLMV